jgi:hypothetical protein
MSENETPADQVRSVMAKNLEQAQPPRLTRVRPVAERQGEAASWRGIDDECPQSSRLRSRQASHSCGKPWYA